jgi:FkbM family methyltransferase
MNKTLFKYNDELVYKEIFEQNVYNLSSKEIAGKGILDLGGHYGMFAMYCVLNQANKIISVEPNHNNLYRFVENTKGTGVRVVCAAISSSSDTITTIADEGCGSRANYGTQLVSTITLNTLLKLFDSNLNLILKIDIEGSEYDIFYNNPPELIKRFEIIVMEAHNYNPETKGNEAYRLREYIEKLGYKSHHNGTFWAEGFYEKYNMAPAYSYKFVKI